MLVLGIDPSINNVGYCFYPDPIAGSKSDIDFRTISPPDLKAPQSVRMMEQARALAYLLTDHSMVTHVGIEQPYVAGAGFRGGGGHQSANMWAVYTLMLDVIRAHHKPVVMFNITQLHSLILRRRGITKQDIILRTHEDLGWRRQNPNHHLLKDRHHTLNEHEADAYWIAKQAGYFWTMMDFKTDLHLSDDQKDIFLGKKAVRGGYNGIAWRGGDFWLDFRTQPPLYTCHLEL